jgi:hypothetical protein
MSVSIMIFGRKFLYLTNLMDYFLLIKPMDLLQLNKLKLTNNCKQQRTANTGLAKVAVQYSADTFVVNQSLVLRINICGGNRHLRQAVAVSPNKNQKINTTSMERQEYISYFKDITTLLQALKLLFRKHFFFIFIDMKMFQRLTWSKHHF